MKTNKFLSGLYEVLALLGWIIFLLYTIANIMCLGGISGWIYSYFFPNGFGTDNFLLAMFLFLFLSSFITIMICRFFWRLFERIDEKS